ncbi:hypothetical protein DER44DRAFT_827945 [Fusarium oxysporum]|nr:hypothetical protein DER44DRAFT_827945 [Fusarium oxysporum]
MPFATGRFGPADGRYWRFEYELTSETFWEEAEQDALKQLEARMEPHLTIPAARFSAGKTAQIWVKIADGMVLLSDHIFRESTSILTVLVLGLVTAQEASELKRVINSGELPPNILADNVVILRGDESPYNLVIAPWISELFPCRPDDLEKMGVLLLRGYDLASFRRRFYSSTHYVLVRQDFIVSSQAKSIEELAG